MPPIEYSPEPLTALRARYPRALEFLYDCAAVRDGGAITPGEVAANVFDFDDGLRLIVSRERLPEGVETVHLSASIRPGSRMAAEVERQVARRDPEHVASAHKRWAAGIPERFRQLAGDGFRLLFVGFSDKAVPHWYAEPV